MALINFPTTPSLNQVYTFGNNTWIYNNTGWAMQSAGSSWNTPKVQTVTYGLTQTINWTQIDVSELTLTGSTTITNSGAVDGQKLLLQVKQGGTGSYTIAFTTETKFGTDLTAIVLSTAVGVVDMIGLQYSSLNGKYNVVAFVKGF
jgi:hypothetical protein